MKNLIETVTYYEDLMRLIQIKDSCNAEVKEIIERMNPQLRNNKINKFLLRDLQLYGESLAYNEDMVICTQSLIYTVGDDNQTKIEIKINEGECFRVTAFGHDTITFRSFNERMNVTMKKSTFRYYFAVINAKGLSISDFFKTKIFTEMNEEMYED